MQYWWLALIILALAVVEVYLAYLLRNKRKLSMILLFSLGTALLIFKSIEFGILRKEARYPVEFSHISYFVFGAVMLAGVKPIRPFAAICSVLAGFGFIIGAVFAPSNVVTSASDPKLYFIIVGIVQHLILWFAGITMLISLDRYRVKEVWILLVGIAIMLIFSVLVHKRILYKDFVKWDDMVIIDILTGNILGYVLPEKFLTMPVRVIGVIGAFALLGGIFWAFYFINRKAFEIRQKKGIEFKDEDFELGIWPLIKYFINKKNKPSAPAVECAEPVSLEEPIVESIEEREETPIETQK